MGGKKTSITNRMRRIRLARTELTQSELARRVGATRQTILALEAQKYAPSLELAFRIAYVSVSYTHLTLPTIYAV